MSSAHLHWPILVDLGQWEAPIHHTPLDQQCNKAGGSNGSANLADSGSNMAELLLQWQDTYAQQVLKSGHSNWQPDRCGDTPPGWQPAEAASCAAPCFCTWYAQYVACLLGFMLLPHRRSGSGMRSALPLLAGSSMKPSWQAACPVCAHLQWCLLVS